jgi:hypothetical protein
LLGWIFLGGAIALIIAGAVVVATKSLGKVNGFHRVSFTSASGTVALNGTGKWVGYYEASNVDSSISRIPGFHVAMTSPSGQNVDLQTYGNRSDGKVKKFTYDYNGHKGAAAFQFTADEKGTYTVQLAAVDVLPAGADVAIGRDIEGGTVAGGVIVIIGILVLIAAVVLLIVGYVKRSRHKGELRAGAFYGGPPPGYGSPPIYGGGPPPGYSAPPPGYSAPPPGYGASPPGYGTPPPGYGASPPGYGGPPPGYSPPPSGYEEPPPSFGTPPPD